MSNWPKRYECLDLDEDLDYNTRWIQCVSLEDFDRALSFCAGLISTMPQFETMHPQTVKEFLITEIKKAI